MHPVRASIRIRLTAWYVAALAVTLITLGAGSYLLTRASLLRWLDGTLHERVEALAEEVRLNEDGPELELAGGHGPYEGLGDGFLLLDGQGRVRVARGIDPRRVTPGAAVQGAFSGQPGTETVVLEQGRQWRITAHPILAQGRVAAVVVVGHDLHGMNELLQGLILAMGMLLPLALGAAGVGGFLLAGRALDPVARMTRAAGEISEQDLARRLPVRSGDELGRLAETFNGFLERLHRAFERQRRFTADASHELRTPLAVIRAVTSQKLMRRRDPDQYEAALRQIDEAAGIMTRLVDQLLMLARADAGQVPLKSEPVELGELVRRAARQVGEATGREILLDAPRSVWVEGDALRLTELVVNLLENAVKFTPAEGEIEASVSRNGTTARMVVRDTGVGIAAEHLPHIFERFYRIEEARSRLAPGAGHPRGRPLGQRSWRPSGWNDGGTGLGLAIGRWIAEAHGGEIRAASSTCEPGRGTTMIVTLPCWEPTTNDAATRCAPLPGVVAAPRPADHETPGR